VSPPLLLGVAASILCWLKGARFIFHVQDLQPDAAVNLGMIKEGRFTRFLSDLERFAYRQAAMVSGISQGMCDEFAKRGVPESKICLFPNWIDLDSLNNLPSAETWTKKHKIPEGTFIVAYAGNLGVKQGLNCVLEAAKLLEDDKSLLFVIAGGGVCKAELLEFARVNQSGNVRFFDVLSEEEHLELLIASDLCLLPQRAGVGAAFLPSKLLKILALRRPVISNADPSSALSDEIAIGGFARVVEQGPEAMSEGIRELKGNPEQRKQLAEAGRLYVEQFDRKKVLGAFVDRLRTLYP